MKGSDISRSAVGTHRDDFADGVRLKCFFFSDSFLSLPPFGSVRTEAPCGEQERPHVEGNTRMRADRQDALSVSGVTSLWWQVMLI